MVVLTCMNTYITCRFFHPPIHNLSAALMGLCLYQGPLLWWQLTRRRGELTMWLLSKTSSSVA